MGQDLLNSPGPLQHEERRAEQQERLERHAVAVLRVEYVVD
jgi:hypothetical protein